jgi:hypothetical protein
MPKTCGWLINRGRVKGGSDDYVVGGGGGGDCYVIRDWARRVADCRHSPGKSHKNRWNPGVRDLPLPDLLDLLPFHAQVEEAEEDHAGRNHASATRHNSYTSVLDYRNVSYNLVRIHKFKTKKKIATFQFKFFRIFNFKFYHTIKINVITKFLLSSFRTAQFLLCYIQSASRPCECYWLLS